MEKENKIIIKRQIFDNGKLIFESDNTLENTLNLMYYLYSKAVNKSKCYTIKNNYNYSDIQKIRIIDKSETLNKREIIFFGVPTSWGSLDYYKIYAELIKEGVINEK